MTLRIGLLSTADINRKLLGGARAAEGVEVVAVASREAARAEAYAAEHGLARAHGSYDALLADDEVDAVYVPLPNSLHVPWSIRALQAGKHVLCEKPLTRRPEDAGARSTRPSAPTASWPRRSCGAITRRRCGCASWSCRAPWAGCGWSARRSRSTSSAAAGPTTCGCRGLDGGGLMDVGCYCVSAMRLLAGEPESVSGRRIDGGDGVDVRFTGALAFGDGVLGSFDCGLDMVDRSALEVVGDGARWSSRTRGTRARRASCCAGPDGDETIGVPQADPYACELEDFAAAVRGERPHPFGRADAVGQARTIAALYRAAEFGPRRGALTGVRRRGK